MKFGAKEKWEKGKMSEITAMYVCMYVHTIQVQHPYLCMYVHYIHTYTAWRQLPSLPGSQKLQ